MDENNDWQKAISVSSDLRITSENMKALSDYLLSPHYRPLLQQAIAARLGNTQHHTGEHRKALNLLEKAFPEFNS